MPGELKKEENNMSFIGIVTRKEQDTGVTLEAKIVTPNKKKGGNHGKY